MQQMPYSHKTKQIAESNRYEALNKNMEESKAYIKDKRGLFDDLQKLQDPEYVRKTNQTLLDTLNKNFKNMDNLMYGLQSDVESVKEHSEKINNLKEAFQETDKSNIGQVLSLATASNNLTADTFEKFLSVEPGLLTTEAVTKYAGLSNEKQNSWSQKVNQSQQEREL